MLQLDDIIPLPLSTVIYPRSHPLAGQTDVVNAYALRHPTGLILVDSGIGEGNAAIDELYQPVRHSLTTALALHGFARIDVVALISTHLHFDHCGQNRLFPGAPIYVQEAESWAAQQPGFTIDEWVSFPGAHYRQIAGKTEIAAGISVLPTPGHTPGYQSVLVDTADGQVLLAGQAVQTATDFTCLHQTGALPAGSAAPDIDAYRRSARRLLDTLPRRVLFSHDRAVWSAADPAP